MGHWFRSFFANYKIKTKIRRKHQPSRVSARNEKTALNIMLLSIQSLRNEVQELKALIADETYTLLESRSTGCDTLKPILSPWGT